MTAFLLLAALAALGTLATSVRILREYERGVVFRLGRLIERKGPGLVFLAPYGLDRMVRVPLRTRVLDVPPQDVITRDNVSVKVNAVVYFRVNDPVSAVMEVEDYAYAVSQLSQTTLRSVVGQSDLDHLLAEREQVNQIIRKLLDEGTDPWGIEVTAVEIKDIDLPENMRRVMAKQAEAERERRARIITADGELQASAKLAEAARIMSRDPAAIQLRFLQTVAEVAAENNSTTLFPLPLELLRPFVERAGGAQEKAEATSRAAEPPVVAGSAALPGPAPAVPGTKLDSREAEALLGPVVSE